MIEIDADEVDLVVIGPTELAARTAVVRAGKIAKARYRSDPCLDDGEMDAIFTSNDPPAVALKRLWADREAESPACPPCVRCGDPGGYTPAGRDLPTRHNGLVFGLDGGVCARCYQRLRAAAGNRGGRKRVERAILPCVECGDPEGRPSKGCSRPFRVSGVQFGRDGEICRRCYDYMNHRRKNPHMAIRERRRAM